MTYKVVLIKVDHRSSEAAKVQDILTEYGCNIKVRLGLHQISEDFCANDGLIILEVDGKDEDLKALVNKLNELNYIQAKMIEM
ncbi:MAG TPA: hypothetical protein GX398_03965 [Candidatus Cloacimonetes bacterium]|jgi:ACT domain-containing protein|nr:hypothetical protein [Candidatus Cloacimonas sp.]HHZ15254.1 hypothetical protein [Candidatus Cloacimonadota bacterium]